MTNDEREPYRPSNGTDGDAFEARWCARCAKFRGGKCGILFRAFAHDVDHPAYPREWVRTEEHRWGTCTAFMAKDEKTQSRPRNRVRPAKGQSSLF